MDYPKALVNEAVRLLNISDMPDLYHRIRRFARVHIKHEQVAPIDTISWPKGSLMCGLMHMAEAYRYSDTSKDRAISVYAVAVVQDYLDRWIGSEAPLYFVDDVLAAQALLSLAWIYEQDAPDLYMHYMRAADGVMRFLYEHDSDTEGVLPYRPAHKTGQIFADSIGMIVPFAIKYGLMKGDEDAVGLGLDQITHAIPRLIDDTSGLPMHVYSLDERYGNIHGLTGWGRALGWIMYGLGAAMDAFDMCGTETYIAGEALKKIKTVLDGLSETAIKYIRDDGLFGSVISDADSPVDTSASAMILYGLGRSGIYTDKAGSPAFVRECIPGRDELIAPLLKYVTPHGSVLQAQGECMGIGEYSGDYGSYPWSVGMTMMLI